jgi:hypothetical protein
MRKDANRSCKPVLCKLKEIPVDDNSLLVVERFFKQLHHSFKLSVYAFEQGLGQLGRYTRIEQAMDLATEESRFDFRLKTYLFRGGVRKRPSRPRGPHTLQVSLYGLLFPRD